MGVVLIFLIGAIVAFIGFKKFTNPTATLKQETWGYRILLLGATIIVVSIVIEMINLSNS